MDANRSSTMPAISNKFTWQRPQVGQDIIVAPKFRKPKLLREYYDLLRFHMNWISC